MNKKDLQQDKGEIKFENQHLAVRDQHYKLVHTGKNSGLFDMRSDPQEQHDCSAQFPEITEKLSNALREWYESILASPRSYSIPVFFIGDPEEPEARIPACLAKRLGGKVELQTSGSTMWTGPGDFQTIPVRVAEAGTYRVFLEYKAEKVNLAEVEVSIGRASVKGTIINHQKQDLGAVELPKGKAVLKIRVVSKKKKKKFFPVFEKLTAVIISKEE